MFLTGESRPCPCSKKWSLFYKLIYFFAASCFGVGLWKWLVFTVDVIVSKQSRCSLFVSARCFLIWPTHFNLTPWWTACFIRTLLELSDPIIFFPIAKIVFIGRHGTHITNRHRTRYAWIFSIWTVADRTVDLHSGKRLLLCYEVSSRLQVLHLRGLA